MGLDAPILYRPFFLDHPYIELTETSFAASPFALMQEYYGIHGSLGARLFDLATSHRQDGQMTYEDFILLKVHSIVMECAIMYIDGKT